MSRAGPARRTGVQTLLGPFCAVGCLLALFGQPPAHYLLAQNVPTVAPAAITTPAPTPLATPTTPPPPVEESASVSHWFTYTVQPADTLLSVALEVGVNLEDMPCIIAPDFSPEEPLVIGNVLALPPPGVLCHAVQPGETVALIAGRYGIPVESVANLPWNRPVIPPNSHTLLAAGLHLRIPLNGSATLKDGPVGLASGADFLAYMLHQPVNTSPFTAYAVGTANRAVAPAGGPTVDQAPANWPYGSGRFVWPLFGWLTQSYRYDHRAIDVAAPSGTPVTAADRGVVIRAGWNNQGYGQFVVIDHNIDYITLYAHLSEILVQEGQVVAQGQAIGRVGSTGNSTGPHLHFEIRDFGRLTNPLELLGK
jgi:murein DD-endopeptidase MepM/ murein hydrolase activator NlpD